MRHHQRKESRPGQFWNCLLEVNKLGKTNLVELDQMSLGQGGVVSPDGAEAEQPEGVEATPLVGLWQLQGSKAPA